jgi:predicted RNA-binding protein with PIN domain
VRIIDGYNLIGAAGELGLALDQPDKEERLLRLLARWRSRRRGREATLVVFDGEHGRLAVGPRRFSRAGIDVEYAIGESADTVIVRRVRGAAHPKQIDVVTSDRGVLRAIESFGARGTRCPEFLASLARALEEQPGAEKPEESSAEEVAAWLERFGGPAGDA